MPIRRLHKDGSIEFPDGSIKQPMQKSNVMENKIRIGYTSKDTKIEKYEDFAGTLEVNYTPQKTPFYREYEKYIDLDLGAYKTKEGKCRQLIYTAIELTKEGVEEKHLLYEFGKLEAWLDAWSDFIQEKTPVRIEKNLDKKTENLLEILSNIETSVKNGLTDIEIRNINFDTIVELQIIYRNIMNLTEIVKEIIQTNNE